MKELLSSLKISSHPCLEVSLVDLMTGRASTITTTHIDEDPIIGPVAKRVGPSTHAFNQLYCLHLGESCAVGGYDSLAVRIRVLDRDSMDHMHVMGGTIMPFVGTERNVVAGAEVCVMCSSTKTCLWHI